MSLKKVLADGFSGGRGAAPRGSLGVLLETLRQAAGGSRRAAGRAAGVAESSLRRWERGARPKDLPGVLRKLQTGIRKLWRTDPTGGTVRVELTNTRPPWGRTVDVDQGAMKRAGDAWERGDLDGMVREFRAGITDDWYRDTAFRLQPEDSQEGHDIEQSDPIVGAVTW